MIRERICLLTKSYCELSTLLFWTPHFLSSRQVQRFEALPLFLPFYNFSTIDFRHCLKPFPSFVCSCMWNDSQNVQTLIPQNFLFFCFSFFQGKRFAIQKWDSYFNIFSWEIRIAKILQSIVYNYQFCIYWKIDFLSCFNDFVIFESFIYLFSILQQYS